MSDPHLAQSNPSGVDREGKRVPAVAIVKTLVDGRYRWPPTSIMEPLHIHYIGNIAIILIQTDKLQTTSLKTFLLNTASHFPGNEKLFPRNGEGSQKYWHIF